MIDPPALGKRVVFLDDLELGDYIVHQALPDGAIGIARLPPEEVAICLGPVYQLVFASDGRSAIIRRFLRPHETLDSPSGGSQ
jgi:hypothetical protein